ncbi:MAG: hypothetical protein ABR499_05735 [Gemmatimonadaceae bacterium]
MLTGGCGAENAAGEPCQMPPLARSAFCWAHDPERAAERAEARRKGGENGRTRGGSAGGNARQAVSLRDVASIQALLEEAATDTRLQENSAQRSRTLGYVCNVAAELLKLGALGELQERIAALERRLAMRSA